MLQITLLLTNLGGSLVRQDIPPLGNYTLVPAPLLLAPQLFIGSYFPLEILDELPVIFVEEFALNA